jgi:hypothetical protein
MGMYLSAIDSRGSDMARDRGRSYKAAGGQASGLLACC